MYRCFCLPLVYLTMSWKALLASTSLSICLHTLEYWEVQSGYNIGKGLQCSEVESVAIFERIRMSQRVV